MMGTHDFRIIPAGAGGRTATSGRSVGPGRYCVEGMLRARSTGGQSEDKLSDTPLDLLLSPTDPELRYMNNRQQKQKKTDINVNSIIPPIPAYFAAISCPSALAITKSHLEYVSNYNYSPIYSHSYAASLGPPVMVFQLIACVILNMDFKSKLGKSSNDSLALMKLDGTLLYLEK